MKLVIDIPEELYKEYMSIQLAREDGKGIVDNLLKAIKKGTPQIEPCEDCISREEVIKLLEKEDWADTVTGVLALPPVQPRRKPGHWKWELASNGWANHICSECGFKENTDIHVKLNWKFCPKCGAEMEANNGKDKN